MARLHIRCKFRHVKSFINTIKKMLRTARGYYGYQSRLEKAELEPKLIDISRRTSWRQWHVCFLFFVFNYDKNQIEPPSVRS